MQSVEERGANLIRIRQAVLLGLFTGTAIGSGFLLSGIPNVETMTLVTAVAGAALGARAGSVVGVLAAAVYSLGNPYGVPVPALLAAQCIGLGAAGVVGAVAGRAVARRQVAGKRRRAAVTAAVAGLVATLLFDGLTNLASAVAFGLDLRVVLAGGIPFALIHSVSNVVLFATLFPVLAPRARLLAGAALRGRTTAGLLLCLVGCLSAGPGQADTGAAAATDTLDVGTAVADTVAGSPAVADTVATSTVARDSLVTDGTDIPAAATRSADRYVPGWQRPLWDPFLPALNENIGRKTRWLQTPDGGLGAALVYLNEVGTAPQPLLLRNGIPLLTGHRLADDQWTYPIIGLELGRVSYGRDGWGGTDGVIDLTTSDEGGTAHHADEAVADTRWFKGPHETYLRGLYLQTPAAPWQFAFGFEEILDNEGYDFRVPGDHRFDLPEEGRGHAKYRSGRGSLRRRLDADTAFGVEFETVRKNKWSLPAYNRENMDLWSQLVGVTWHDATPAGKLTANMFWIDRDVEWDRGTESLAPASADRKIEVSREGVRLELAGDSHRRLSVSYAGWRLADSGETGAWAGSAAGPVQDKGREATAAAATDLRLAGTAGVVGLQLDWDSYGGALLGGWFDVAQDRERPWWRVTLERGGRAPRSDELLTPWTVAVPGRATNVLANRDLQREQTWRAALELQGCVIGIDLAAVGTARWLSDGIGYNAGAADTLAGRWTNDLQLNGQTVTASAAWGGRFLGWLRFKLAATWRRDDLRAGVRPNLPPDLDGSLQVLWENHFFREDGILQAGYFLVHRGAMSDPWSFDRAYDLPSITKHDLFLGFRLVGVSLSVAIRNLTGEPLRLTAGSLSPGREIQWRLHWTFYK